MKNFPIKFKIVAILLVFIFTFQSMESINSYTYKSTGTYIHARQPCLFIFQDHLSYYCSDFHQF